jgi:hypothetical protein
MANYYAPIAPFRTGPGINLEPVNAALDGILQQQNLNRSFGLQQQASDRADEQLKISQGEFGLQQDQAKRQRVADLGKQALAIDQLTDPNQRAAAWQGWVRAHGADGLSPEEMDPVTGPKLAAAQAGQYVDPMAREQSAADLAYKRAQTTALVNKQNDPVEAMLLERLRGTGSQPSAAGTQSSSPQPQFSGPRNQALPPMPMPQAQPQSYTAPSPAPGIQFASDTATVPGSPSAQPQAAPQAPDMIDTPYGRMTREEAKQMGGTMLLSPKYAAAGKALFDAAGGASDPNALGKTAANQNDKEELTATGQLATLNSIKSNYNEKFLNIPTRFKLWGASLADKFGALNPQDKADLTAYTQFRQSSWHNLNRVLKDLSGTAVTDNEMQRQLLDLPNPGKGIADGDSPTEFDAKLKNSIAFTTSAIARARYLRTRGFTGKPWEAGIAVEDMPAIINQRGAEIEQQLKQSNPNASPTQLQQATTRQIKQEFGI